MPVGFASKKGETRGMVLRASEPTQETGGTAGVPHRANEFGASERHPTLAADRELNPPSQCGAILENYRLACRALIMKGLTHGGRWVAERGMASGSKTIASDQTYCMGPGTAAKRLTIRGYNCFSKFSLLNGPAAIKGTLGLDRDADRGGYNISTQDE
ncbi:hypothetical protein BC826DRAFT_967039 [Russula brevipes]|nr:hypothetical protein BC826DRAFT_967039 [Russula brevipes]